MTLRNTPDSIYSLMLDLVKIPSFSATPGERLCAERICEHLSALSAFRKNPEDLRRVPVPGSPHGSEAVVALVRAEPPTNRTVILEGHFDVVDIEVYGPLKDVALDPEACTCRMKDMPLPDEARRDLESGNYLFGRGVMDMKFGLAMAMCLLAEASENPGAFGVNLMLVAVPDEENNSAGMRAAVSTLADVQEEGLDLLGCIMVEPSDPGYIGGNGRVVSFGAVGKIMPFVLVMGKEAHGSEYFDGINANLVMAHLNLLLEGNPDLADIGTAEHYPPMACLKQKDLREAYSITLPERACAYYSLITTCHTPETLLQRIDEAAATALRKTAEHLDRCKRTYAERAKLPGWPSTPTGRVLRFSNLLESARKTFGASLDTHLAAFLSSLPASMDEREKGIALVNEVLTISGEKGPLAVTGFMPPFYPYRTNFRATEKERFFARVGEAVVAEAKETFGETLHENEHFGGVSDLSYLGFQGNPADLEALRSNLPGWGTLYDLPVEDLLKLDIPALNIGPSGKDAHKMTERLELGYSLNVAPKLLRSAVLQIGAYERKRGERTHD
ncbi:MAG: M20/M25/M40 family metallo-hydrolase [Synergistaceae bacterium]|nr:M20/M25/M40 family metallo-hydrolase [Synergistaceae bacterium]